MKTIVIIPARMASSRFPGKPLCEIVGLTMIEHVYRRCLMNQSLSGVYVATCDAQIQKTVESFGGIVTMTSSSHQRCTDRVAEAAQNINSDADIIVLVQGDEPLVHPQMIECVIEVLVEDPKTPCANLIVPIEDDAEFRDPNVVKVVKDVRGFALYFSRQPIPTQKESISTKILAYKQTGIVSFRREFLYEFIRMKPTPLEINESVDMMRIVEHGCDIKLVESPHRTYTVDTLEDKVKMEKMMRMDSLFLKYGKANENSRDKRFVLPV